MKKNIINLLINREDYQKYENLFERLKLTATILTIILAILFTYFYISIKNKFNIYEKMNLQKKTYLQMLTNRRGDEAKINYIEKKYSDLKNFLKDDASSVTYFEILSDSIKNSSESAKLLFSTTTASKRASAPPINPNLNKSLTYCWGK